VDSCCMCINWPNLLLFDLCWNEWDVILRPDRSNPTFVQLTWNLARTVLFRNWIHSCRLWSCASECGNHNLDAETERNQCV
jgi:hypothetical protein